MYINKELQRYGGAGVAVYGSRLRRGSEVGGHVRYGGAGDAEIAWEEADAEIAWEEAMWRVRGTVRLEMQK